jgi:thiol-disulfide isomerase/thioredoxin
MNGIQVPNLAITGMTGRVTSLGDLAKDGALVGLFTTTCPHCLRTMPAWKELEDEAARVNLPFVAVSLHDQRRTWSFVNSTSSPQAVWVVSSREVSQRAGLPGVPFTVLVGEGGIIKETWLGALREKDIRNIVERLVDTRPAP